MAAVDPEDGRWLDFAKEYLSPTAGLKRVDAAADLVLTRVSLVGVVLAGFGVAIPTLGAGQVSTTATGAIAWMAGAASVLALLARSRVPWFIHLDRPDEIRSFYEWRVRLRGGATLVAHILLAGSVVTALFVGHGAASSVREPEPSLSLRRAGDTTVATITILARDDGWAVSAQVEVKTHGEWVAVSSSELSLPAHARVVVFDDEIPCTDHIRFVGTFESPGRPADLDQTLTVPSSMSCDAPDGQSDSAWTPSLEPNE